MEILLYLVPTRTDSRHTQRRVFVFTMATDVGIGAGNAKADATVRKNEYAVKRGNTQPYGHGVGGCVRQ